MYAKPLPRSDPLIYLCSNTKSYTGCMLCTETLCLLFLAQLNM